MSDHLHVRVGVAVFARCGDDFLILHRVKEHGNGTWGLPGGHLDKGEAIEDCAFREVEEETGIRLENLRLLPTVTNDIFPESEKHYVTLYVEGDAPNRDYVIKEPWKYDEYRWVNMTNLPRPLFLCIDNYVKKVNEHVG